MKKALLFTLAALCVSAAQAVTVTWSGADSQEIKNVDYTKDIKITYVYTLDSAITSKTTLWWAGFDGATVDETNALEYRYAPFYDGANILSFLNSNHPPRQLIEGGMTAGDHTLEVIFNTENKTAKITHNGTLYSLTLADTTESTSLWLKTMETPSSSTITVEYTTIVPEPTVLALLALGAAGLALKRKVA